MHIFLAMGPSPIQPKTMLSYKDATRKPKILVSFHYLSQFKDTENYQHSMKNFKGYQLVLDSGAFSAYNAKKTIDIEALIEETKNPIWNESVCLDVIGDANASWRNSIYMKKKGSPAYPVFHIGDPLEMLVDYCAEFPKVGLSCRFGETETDSLLWLDNCFNKCWPHKFHSFGWIKEDMLMRFPFHSGDASSWATAPMAYGAWKSLGRMSVRGMSAKNISLRAEVDEYLRLETRLAARWRDERRKQGWDEFSSGSSKAASGGAEKNFSQVELI